MFWIASGCLIGLLIIIFILLNTLSELRSIKYDLQTMKLIAQETRGDVARLTERVALIWRYGGAHQAEKDEDEWRRKRRDRDPTDDA